MDGAEEELQNNHEHRALVNPIAVEVFLNALIQSLQYDTWQFKTSVNKSCHVIFIRTGCNPQA